MSMDHTEEALRDLTSLRAIEPSVFDVSRYLAILTGSATVLSSWVVVAAYILNPDMRSGWRHRGQ